MIDQIANFFVLTAFFLLVFILFAGLAEGYGERIKLVLKKIHWNTIIKIFCLWAVIIFLRKLTYYFHFNGIIQTKNVLFWVDENAKMMILYSIMIMTGAIGIITGISGLFNVHRKRSDEKIALLIVFSIFLLSLSIVLISKKDAFLEILSLMIILPLLLLKMLFSGKYFGLLTALLAAYYIIDRHKKIKTGMIKINVKLFIVPILIIIGILILGYFRFTGDWQEKFINKAQTAKSTNTVNHLIEAAHSIRDSERKNLIFNETGLIYANRGKIKWSQEMFQQAVHSANSVKNWEMKSNLLKDISVTIAKTGDIKSAMNLTNTIMFVMIKIQAFKEIITIVLKKGDIKIAEEILKKSIDTIRILNNMRKLIAEREVASLIIGLGNVEWSEEILQKMINFARTVENDENKSRILKLAARAILKRKEKILSTKLTSLIIEAVGTIENSLEKSILLREISAAVAKTGDIKRASSIAHNIPINGIRSLALTDIREIKGNE